MNNTLDRLIAMMEALRSAETGCPWDKRQTNQSLTPHTLEETHELIAAIESGDREELKDELGDLLFQIVFYAQIAKEDGDFDLIEIMEHLISKMRRRHPHVFGNQKFTNEDELKAHWEKTKRQEKQQNHKAEDFSSVLKNVPVSMPALSRSQKLQNRAAKTGFDWKNIDRVKEKLYEEISELEQAIDSGNKKHIQHEIGDLLTACVNLSRHLDVDAEQALRAGNQRFENRFKYIERAFYTEKREITESSLEELESYWQQAKDYLKDH